MNNTKARTTAVAVTAATPGMERTFDVDRKHTTGQFLRAHPTALQVMKQQQREARGAFSIQQRARYAS